MNGPDDVLAFWFGTPPYAARAEWFRKSDAFDDDIRQRFGATVEAALAGALDARWAVQPLAEIVLLDQFTRNIFRASARAFAGDARALALSRHLVANGAHLALHPLQRWFAYLPFEHSEVPALQDESVRLFGLLAAEPSAGPEAAAALASALDYAERHREVIRRFGRFPHRNAALGRTSSADELAYLAQPGAGF